MHLRFAWKLYAICTAAILLTAGAIGVLTLGQLETVLLREKEESLRHQCLRIAPLAAELFRGERGRAQELASELGADSGTRITLLALDGEVLADSHEDPGLMDDHSDRPELRDLFRKTFEEKGFAELGIEPAM